MVVSASPQRQATIVVAGVDTHGASRAAVRTALLELATEGLVDRLSHRGSRVGAISPSRRASPMPRSTSSRHCADILKAVESDLFEYSRLNQVLDRRVREIAHHPTAVAILERLRAQGVRHQFRRAFSPGRAAVSAPEHAAIIDAIMARDAARAEAETRTHLGSVIEALRTIG